MIEKDLKIKEYQNEIDKINKNFEKKENAIENTARNSLILYSAGAIITPCALVTGHPHLAMISTGAAILSISAFSLSLGTIVSTDKKIDKIKEKIKKLEK